MTDSEKIDALTKEIALIKAASRDQLIYSYKISSLLQLLLSKAGYSHEDIHRMMLRDHDIAAFIEGEKLGYIRPLDDAASNANEEKA